MNKNEYKRYEDIGNWDFSMINYHITQESSWDFYKQIKKFLEVPPFLGTFFLYLPK